MSENKALWDRVFVTDPRAVRPISGKDYQGNSPKPYWIVERLTDEFGPCGIGWGFTVLSDRFERFSETDSLHVAIIRFWYILDGKRGEIEQLGQTKASYTTSKGQHKIDEDAPKKSVTDALVKCASYIGFAGDIFSGRWDDSRYVAEARAEWAARANPSPKVDDKPHAPARLVAASVSSSLSDEKKADLDERALLMADNFEGGHGVVAMNIWNGIANNDEKAYLWHLLASEPKLRAFIKANKAAA